MADIKFINPYNFIPLGDKKTVYTPEGELMTGYIDCELTTKTPLIMIDTESEKVEQVVVKTSKGKKQVDHKIYPDTYAINGQPFIPGSELRGAIRSKFETMTNSCMSSAEDLKFISRHKGNMKQPGIIDVYKGELYECNAYEISDKTKLKPGTKTGTRVRFDVPAPNVAVLSDKGQHTGYFKHGQRCGYREAFHVFEIKEQGGNRKIVHASNESEFVPMLKLIKTRYQENLGSEGTKIKHHNSESCDKMQPVWYEKSISKGIISGKQKTETFVYFSLGQNGQTQSRRTMFDLLKGYLPCTSEKCMCEACRTFGTVQKDSAFAGHVRVSDARLISSDKDLFATNKMITLPELSTPKYTNALFYMCLKDEKGNIIGKDGVLKDKAGHFYDWTVDYKHPSVRNASIQEISDDQINIRGRKEYWHHEPDLKTTVPKTNRNRSVRPLNSRLVYGFKVYFNDITEKQLKDLYMAITLGAEEKYCHKLGMGKPLGYGSVKIKADKVYIRNVNGENGYEVRPYKEDLNEKLSGYLQAKTDCQEMTRNSILNMYNKDYVNRQDAVKIDYPTRNGKIYEWFGNNKKPLPFADSTYDNLILKGTDRNQRV